MLGAGCVDATDFLRSGLLVGLEQEQAIGANPVKLGVIASTDTHTASPGSVMEDDWRGHVSVEASPQERLQPRPPHQRHRRQPGRTRRRLGGRELPRRHLRGHGASRSVRHLGPAHHAPLLRRLGLPPGALRFARASPRSATPAASRWAATWTHRRTPRRSPVFLASALRDPAPNAAPLQQLQLIKGWIDGDGKRRTEVIPIAGGPNDASVDTDDGPAARRRPREPVRRLPRRGLRPEPARLLLPARGREPVGLAGTSTTACAFRKASVRRSAATTPIPATIQEMAWTSPSGTSRAERVSLPGGPRRDRPSPLLRPDGAHPRRALPGRVRGARDLAGRSRRVAAREPARLRDRRHSDRHVPPGSASRGSPTRSSSSSSRSTRSGRTTPIPSCPTTRSSSACSACP